MLQSLTPIVSIVFLSSVRKRLRLLGRADVRLGDDLHERRADAVEVDERVRAVGDAPLELPACTSLAASSSMCARVIPTRKLPPSPSGTSRCPSTQIGLSYWEIWYAFGLSA